MLKIVVVGAQQDARRRLFQGGKGGRHGVTDVLQAGLQEHFGQPARRESGECLDHVGQAVEVSWRRKVLVTYLKRVDAVQAKDPDILTQVTISYRIPSSMMI